MIDDFDAAVAAPEWADATTEERVVEASLCGPLDRYGFDISCLDENERIEIDTAVLDALPQGRDAAFDAAANKAREMAERDGWLDDLLGL